MTQYMSDKCFIFKQSYIFYYLFVSCCPKLTVSLQRYTPAGLSQLISPTEGDATAPTESTAARLVTRKGSSCFPLTYQSAGRLLPIGGTRGSGQLWSRRWRSRSEGICSGMRGNLSSRLEATHNAGFVLNPITFISAASMEPFGP